MTEANFHQARMLRANMRGASGENVEFTLANMRDVNLSGAVLPDSTFYLVDFTGSDFSGADFSRSIFRSAILGNTNQTRTTFTGAMMPDNSIRP